MKFEQSSTNIKELFKKCKKTLFLFLPLILISKNQDLQKHGRLF